MSFRHRRPLSRLFGLLGLAAVALAPACDDVVAGRAVTPPPPAPGPTAPLRVQPADAARPASTLRSTARPPGATSPGRP
ncbi:MAG: hypothetical protein U1F43_20210 [Myxococcota bacterium]